MTSRNNTILSEKEELLLSRYYDGECGAFSSFFAKRLLQRNKAARDFLHNLESYSSGIVAESSNRPLQSVNLWARIENRIEQEEKAAFYLGDRRVTERAPSLIERLRGSQVAVGGLSGAAIAAAAIFFLYSPKDISSFSVPFTASTSNSSNQFQQIGFGNSQRSPQGMAFTQASNRALEVDWMRSNGSLSLIPGANGSSAVIWVRRRAAIPSQSRGYAALRPTPLGRAEPTATIAAHREWLDGKPLNSAK